MAINLPFVGSLLDTASGMYDSYKNRQQQNDSMHNSISYRVADAKRAGIHPLAALGASTFSPKPIHTSSDFKGMGQALDKQSPANTMHEKNQRRLDNEYRQEQILNIRQSTAESKARVLGINNPTIPGLNNSSPYPGISGQNSPRLPDTSDPAIQYKPSEIPISKSVGLQAGNQPLELHATSPYGTVYKLPTKDVQEGISEGSIFTQLKYNLGQLADYFAGYPTYLWPKDMADTKRILSKTRPRASSTHEFRYNIFRGSWVLRAKKGKTQFWDHTKKPLQRRKSKPLNKSESKLWNY